MAEGKRYDFSFETDPQKLAQQTVGEQIKYNRTGGPLQTTRSASPRGDPTNLTIYSVSEILQNVPAYESPQDSLGRFEEVMNADVALSLKDGAKGDGSVLGDYFRAGLLPSDVQARIGAIQLAEGIYTDQATAAGSTGVAGTGDGGATAGAGGVSLPGAAAFSELETHPRVGGIVPGFAADAKAGLISPNVIWILKFLADNLGNHGLTLFIGVGKTGHARLVHGTNKESNHYTGRAVDCSIKGIPFTDLRGFPGVQTVYDLLSSLHGAGLHKPYTTGGPPPQPARVSGGTLWFTNADHYDHFHIDVSQFDGPPDAPAVGVPGATSGVAGSPAPGSTPAPRSSTAISIGAITTRLPNQHAIVTPNATQIDLQNRCLTVVQRIIEADPTIKPEYRNHFYVAMIESGWAESGWINNPGGDASSVGIFQLLSMHGTYEQRMTPEFGANWWGTNARGVPAKNGRGTAGDIAWQTERPATKYRYKYDTWRNQAVSDLARLGIDARSVDP